MQFSVKNNGRSSITTTKPLQARVQQHLSAQIRHGSLSPGDRLPTIKEISNKLNVSTTVTFLAVKKMREGGWFEKISERKHIVSNGVNRLLEARPLRIGFASCGNAEHRAQH